MTSHVYWVGDVECKFIELPLGAFFMGSNAGFPLEQPVHKVHIASAFAVLQAPVTQALYVEVVGNNPSAFRGERLPVENVTWEEACRFCIALSERLGCNIRLPRESEWEYFCRAGTQSEYFFGDDSKRVPDYAWYDMNSMGSTHPVDEKQANPWGLFDVIGNVWEWCEDRYASDYSENAFVSAKRVIRGGAYDMNEFRMRSAYRSSEYPEMRLKQLGFRVVMDCP